MCVVFRVIVLIVHGATFEEAGLAEGGLRVIERERVKRREACACVCPPILSEPQFFIISV